MYEFNINLRGKCFDMLFVIELFFAFSLVLEMFFLNWVSGNSRKLRGCTCGYWLDVPENRYYANALSNYDDYITKQHFV